MDNSTTVYPVVALRGLVVFPGAQMHFDVARAKSIAAFRAAMTGNQTIFLVAQKEIGTDDPDFSDIYEIGVTASIRQILKLPGEDGIRVVIEGLKRGRIVNGLQKKPFLQAQVVRR